MPPEYLVELELLQDRIPPFPSEAAMETVEEELGVPMDQVSVHPF
jgi:aarF domain-containing kinase